ncbi:MAG: membrane dipeptidase [Planctomycetota bacterium]|nr:membrane dipeptidase [Planctomycetota bacterium]
MDWMIVDGHQDIAMALLEDENWDFARPACERHALSLADSKRGGVVLILGTVFATAGYWKDSTPADSAERQMGLYEDLLTKHAADLFRVESKGDLKLCQAGGPIGLIHLMEGADPIRSPRDLKRWARRGVRVVGPAWNTGNRYCGGWDDARGLTADGRRLIAEMRRQQVIPDVSHLKPAAFEDVLDCDDGILVASHSNAHALQPHRRNLTNEQIRAVAARDGLVGVVLYNPFLGEGPVTVETVLDHVEHMVDLVGPDHVGLGSDLDGGFPPADAPQGIDSVADLRRIGDGLAGRGLDGEAIAKILGGNWMRILRRTLPE